MPTFFLTQRQPRRPWVSKIASDGVDVSTLTVNLGAEIKRVKAEDILVE